MHHCLIYNFLRFLIFCPWSFLNLQLSFLFNLVITHPNITYFSPILKYTFKFIFFSSTFFTIFKILFYTNLNIKQFKTLLNFFYFIIQLYIYFILFYFSFRPSLAIAKKVHLFHLFIFFWVTSINISSLLILHIIQKNSKSALI